eukprot:491379_1
MSVLDLINSLINKVDATINNNMEEDTKMGGIKDFEIDEMVLATAEAVKQQVIEKANSAQIKEYEVVSAKFQVVVGINYCIKIKTDKNSYIHVCVYAKLDKSYELQGICFDKTLNDPCDFSCTNNKEEMDRNPLYINLSNICKETKYGLGLFAGVTYKKGDIVDECIMDKNNRFEDEMAEQLRVIYKYDKVNDEDWAFEWDTKHKYDHFAQGLITYANHSKDANVELQRDICNYKMKAIALRDIGKDEEIFHCYKDGDIIELNHKQGIYNHN